MPDLPAALADLSSVAAACVAATSSAETLTDDELLASVGALASSSRLLETATAALAAEVEHRSRRELGYSGLAQSRGARTAENLVQTVTGSSSATARRLVRVGTLVARNAGLFDPPAEPWLAEVLAAAGAGTLSGEAVDAIRGGLGAPNDGVSADALAEAARALLSLAPTVTVERLAALARERRDDLDAAGVALREEQVRARRSARRYPQADGMSKWVLWADPESDAVLSNALDAATSPRRGGPRFTDPDDVARAERILGDPRTTEQLALDALIELVDVATRGDSAHILGSRRPEVRVLVTQRDLDARSGAGHIDGQSSSVSLATVERLACDGGYLPILFSDDGEGLNLGRRSRSHDHHQRTVIAARDGGCIGPECDRPASWTEVHHVIPWGEHGETSVQDGVCLCRYHHMLLHNTGCRIERRGARYWWHWPPDSNRQPMLLSSRSAALRSLLWSA